MRRWTVTLCGLGYLPIAPGTWGSAGACVVYLLLWWAIGGIASDARSAWLDASLGVLALVACWGTVAFGQWAIDHFGRDDPGAVVLDEGAGQWLALMFLPWASGYRLLVVVFVQFAAFRVFDIFKPPPARQLERLPAGWGILCDDLMAGVYANLVGQVVFRFLWRGA